MKEVEIIECDFANPAHTQRLVELINSYIADEMGGGELLTGDKSNDLITGLKNHPSKLILFATYSGSIGGLTNCFINFGTFAARPFISIHDVIVDPAFRGKGLGKALMNGISERAAALGCSKITLEVREDNLLAQNLYKSLDYKDIEPKMFFWTKYL